MTMNPRSWLPFSILMSACATIPTPTSSATFVVVSLDHLPTSADSIEAVRLGAASVNQIPLAHALAITTTSNTAIFRQLQGEVAMFTDSSFTTPHFVDVLLGASPTAIDRSLVASLSTVPVSSIGSNDLLADIRFAQLNDLHADPNVQAILFEHNYHAGSIEK